MSGCKQCGSRYVAWESYIDEDGCKIDEPGDYCDYCLDVMAERSRQRREWEYCHEEPCPEIEMTPLPKRQTA